MADEYYERFPGGASVEVRFDVARRDADLIEDAIKGWKPRQLQDKYKLSDRQVSRILRDAAVRVREDAADLIAEAFHRQHERLERLYSLVEIALQEYENPDTRGGFDDRPFRVAVAIFDRQAKLMGMDRGGTKADKSVTGWMDGAPIEQVVDYAKSLKMNIPTQFET